MKMTKHNIDKKKSRKWIKRECVFVTMTFFSMKNEEWRDRIREQNKIQKIKIYFVKTTQITIINMGQKKNKKLKTKKKHKTKGIYVDDDEK